MRILVTGASGFIGRKLVAALLHKGKAISADGTVRAITELVLADLAAPAAAPAANGIVVRCESGDLGDPAVLAQLFAEPVDSLFHLAASLTTEAEADVARGIAVNVEGFCACWSIAGARQRCPGWCLPVRLPLSAVDCRQRSTTARRRHRRHPTACTR